ncbi:MAG: glycosyltransferase [Xenococcaceae cyanobacterium]
MKSLNINSDLDSESRVLILSQRNLVDQVANSCLYDFEDLVCEFDNVDILAPQNSWSICRKTSRIRSFLPRSIDIEKIFTPFTHQFNLEKEYDLLFVVVDNAWQLITLNSLKNWQKKCKKIVCYIVEIWDKEINDWKIIQDLQKFDHIFLGVNHCTKKLALATNKPCTYLPPAVNTIQFCAYPNIDRRNIDICYLGRRSPITHQSIIEYATKNNRFYYYDTAKNMRVANHQEHRNLYANIVKRSRYFIANYAKIDQLHETHGIQEIGARFFEGVAAGTVLLGQPPATETFKHYFDWQDAIVPMPFNVSDVGETIDSLERQSDRLEKISRNNTCNALLRHDWLYRWQTVLNSINIPHTRKMLLRKDYLDNLARSLQT